MNRLSPVRLLMPVIALALLAGACSKSSSTSTSGTTGGGSSSTTAAKLAAATLNGSGSTFQKAFNDEVIADFKKAQPNLTVNYGGGGSGKGRQDLADQVTDFAGSDGLIAAADQAKFKGGPTFYFPTVAAPITLSYNLSGVDKLTLDADTAAKIFQTDIKTWDDPAIKALNASAKLPSKPIVVVHRSDSSGTTENFTKYLTAASTPGTFRLKAGSTVDWPAGTQAGNGNPGVAQAIKGADGAIGYVDFSDAKASQLKFASVKNKAGKVVEPSLAGTSAALAKTQINPDLSYNPLNAAGDDAYPIATPTWIITYQKYTDKAKVDALKAFLGFIYTTGQDKAEGVDFAKLPDSFVQAAKAQVDKLTGG